MKDFDLILEDCLERLASGASSLDECLLRYPEHASQLRPLLHSASRLEHVRDVLPSPAFKTRARAQLMAHMQAHPRHRQGMSPFLRLAFNLAVLMLAFLFAGTALAQSALPGEPLYGWKLVSETAWRALSPNPLGTDLALADRRVAELVAVAEDPQRSAMALELYRSVLSRLKSETEAGAHDRILPVLQAHQSLLLQAGLSVPELDAYVHDYAAPETTPTAPAQPTSTPIIEMPVLETALPEIPSLDTAIPETPALPEIIPTVDAPDIPLPTLEIPPLVQ
jgi:hypothetical protein